jgi:predicted DNA-binding protein
MHRLTVLCEERQAERVQRLATRYGVTEQEVVRQLIDAGLEHIDESDPEPEPQA